MAIQKKSPQQFLGKLVADEALRIARDPAVHQTIIKQVGPMAAGAGKLAKSAADRVKPAPKPDPFIEIEKGLSAVEVMIDEQARGIVPAGAIAAWRHTLTSLRTAVPLAKADIGKGRNQKVKDLRKRQHSLLDEVYAAIVAEGKMPGAHGE